MNWMVVNVSDKTFWSCHSMVDETLPWKLIEDVTFMELFHQVINSPPPKINPEELFRYIDQAIADRNIWIRRRNEQIDELRDLKKKLNIAVCYSMSHDLFQEFWQKAKAIRGTYGASKSY